MSCHTILPAPMLRCLEEESDKNVHPLWTSINVVPDFRVAHEALAETHCGTRGGKGAMGVVLGDGVHVGRVCSLDGVSGQTRFCGNTPAIVDAVVHDSTYVQRIGCSRTYMRQTLFLTSAGMVDVE